MKAIRMGSRSTIKTLCELRGGETFLLAGRPHMVAESRGGRLVVDVESGNATPFLIYDLRSEVTMVEAEIYWKELTR